MLVNLKELLAIAEERKIAVGAFNAAGLECIEAIFGAAEELNMPFVLMFAQLHEPWMHLETIGPIMMDAARRSKVPVCVMLDHGEDLEYLKQALDLGFTAIMYDGSTLPYEENVALTKKVVEYLSKNPNVSKVNHPSLPDHPDHALYEKYFPNGGASIFTFEIKGGKEAAWKFIDNLKIFSLLANVADVKSLVIHPASTTHSQLSEEELLDQGITQSTIRLSIGTEHIDDIIGDLEAGFKAVNG